MTVAEKVETALVPRSLRSGTLPYFIEIEQTEHEIGGNVTFTVKPVNPGLVNARAKSCSVYIGDENVATIFGEEAYCRNGPVQFTIGEGFGADGDETFSFKAFKRSDA